MCGQTCDELNARFGDRLAFIRYGGRRTSRHDGVETLARPRSISQVVEPFLTLGMPAPHMWMNTAVVSAILNCSNDSRTRFRHPVRSSPRVLDLWIYSQEPVELNRSGSRLFQLPAKSLDVLDRGVGSFPSSRTVTCFARVGLDIDQEQDGAAVRSLLASIRAGVRPARNVSDGPALCRQSRSRLVQECQAPTGLPG